MAPDSIHDHARRLTRQYRDLVSYLDGEDARDAVRTLARAITFAETAQTSRAEELARIALDEAERMLLHAIGPSRLTTSTTRAGTAPGRSSPS